MLDSPAVMIFAVFAGRVLLPGAVAPVRTRRPETTSNSVIAAAVIALVIGRFDLMYIVGALGTRCGGSH